MENSDPLADRGLGLTLLVDLMGYDGQVVMGVWRDDDGTELLGVHADQRDSPAVRSATFVLTPLDAGSGPALRGDAPMLDLFRGELLVVTVNEYAGTSDAKLHRTTATGLGALLPAPDALLDPGTAAEVEAARA